MEKLDLQKIRGQLDEIDDQIVTLYEERMKLCSDVAEFKIKTGKAVYDPERERQKLSAVQNKAHGEFNRIAVREIFSQLMAVSRKHQYQLLAENGKGLEIGFERVSELNKAQVRVAYQGVEGSYGHGAALQFFGRDNELYHVAAMEDVLREVEEGRADYGVLPIENSSAGAVSDNYDLLVKHNNYIVAETKLKVNHALLGLPEAKLEDIEVVYSHPQALMQCSRYLNAHSQWRQISLENTAAAARKVTRDQNKSQAAVASEIAGAIYGLKILAPAINYNGNNTTRFLILSRRAMYCEGAGKVSICFEVAHQSGSLYNMLGHLIYNHVNMLMIESRPIEGRSWEYRFFVDVEGSLGDVPIQNALKGIAEEAVSLRILGSY